MDIKMESNPSTHPPIIMFDFDGVIINSKGAELAALQMMKDPFFEWDEEELAKINPLEIIRRFEMCDDQSSYQSVKKLWFNFRALLPNWVKRIRFFIRMGLNFRKYEKIVGDFIPGITDTLKLLYEKGAIMGIGTNSEGDRLPYWLDKKDCREYISAWTSRYDKKIYGIKPEPRVLLKLLLSIKKKHNIKKINMNRVFFVGDNPTDIWAAQNAKMRSIAVLSGHSSYDELAYLGADYILKSINEMPDLIEIKNMLNTQK
jgi:phosphoglycolate phosphatase-like HAD superfamily hydrolase